MIEELLPESAACADAFGDACWDAPGGPAGDGLFAEEAALVRRAVAERRREFATVRRCARRALAELGLPPVPLLPGPRGAVRWPPGVVGSMTHCAGYRASALARDRDVAAVGIDAEPDAALPDGVLESIALPQELHRIRQLTVRHPGTAWDRLLFSAKEAVYKAWYPAVRRELDFTDAEIAFEPDAGTFRVRLLVPGLVLGGRPLTRLDGRWTARRGLVVTAVAVTAASA